MEEMKEKLDMSHPYTFFFSVVVYGVMEMNKKRDFFYC